MLNRLQSVTLAAALAAAPIVAHAQGVPQVLQGLMNGNQDRDQAVRDAYERGYQKGRQDEAALRRDRRSGDENSGRNPSYNSRDNTYNPRDNTYSR